MTKPKASKSEPAGRVLTVIAEAGETEPQTMARVIVAPFIRHGILGQLVAAKAFQPVPGDPNFDDFGAAIQAKANAATRDWLSRRNPIPAHRWRPWPRCTSRANRRCAMCT